MKKVLVWLACALLAVSAHAGITLSKFPPNPGVLPGGGFKMSTGSTFAEPPPVRAWTNGVYGSVPAVVATDSMVLAGPGGSLAVDVAQKVNLLDAATAIASVLAPEVGAALTAGQLIWKAYRVMNETDGHGGPQTLRSDPGQAPEGRDVNTYRCFQNDAWTGSSADEACMKYATDRLARDAASSVPWTADHVQANGPCRAPETGVTNNGCSFTEFMRDGGGNLHATTYFTSFDYAVVTQTGCPASIDALDPAQSIPAGGTVGADGLCPTARYNHKPISPLEAGKLMANSARAPDPSLLTNATQQAVEQGAQAPATVSVNGPASQTGDPTVSNQTNPDGSTVHITDTPTYNFNYSGDTITYSETHNTVTQTCIASGSCSTTTNNTSTPTKPATPAPDPCTDNPTRVGCAALGTPSTASPIPNVDVPVTITPITFAAPAACPVPETFSMFGHSYDLSYQPLCNVLGTLRLIFLAFAALGAAYIFMEGLRS